MELGAGATTMEVSLVLIDLGSATFGPSTPGIGAMRLGPSKGDNWITLSNYLPPVYAVKFLGCHF